MITAVALGGYAALVGTAVPALLSRARWPHRAPVIAVLAWQGLMATFVVATALMVYHLVLTERHVHEGLVGLLGVCGLAAEAPVSESAPTLGDVLALSAPAVIVLLPFGWFVLCTWRARRARQRHLDMLTLVGEPAPGYDATVVDHGAPAVYCLPGRRRRVVVTQAALDVLSDAQMRAVLEHERAHIEGRHHLLHLLIDAFSRAFPGLPLARHAKEQITLLVEMIADDRALRSHSRDALATAMCEVAAGQAPRGALGVGGPGALIRLRRVLAPRPRPHRVTWLGVVVASTVAPLLPLLVACGP
ncbi:M56 family metallopeptidase [Streptomyces rapamycinicus]|uniref:Membrane protein n=2 Tax=Streptomyces rapamycinicus TaxID=1226757 RepID=A0A0A0NI34_STRRN|nr:M56 family metallopeptidase [Streptomyces rapamycinicus]AGP54055.1 membrane protein [Streptomyces rapamycinicus NRRL 5491]MBB4781551.1 Zn-dependent protease with chaperone function [Streptomyces rapamycinicus]RLV73805.1 membrane protein [Streptomyces rapamycinicus NRRL 5491]UTO62148.1 M56 family metallopeptidase [Streptomyces rapamycinicus]UTP30100.1 M56 family metallopeptidase [Streptomyces rapamycinicus NRRL 5491]